MMIIMKRIARPIPSPALLAEEEEVELVALVEFNVELFPGEPLFT